MFMSYPVDFLP